MARSPLQCLCEESEVVCVRFRHTGAGKRHTDLELHLVLPSEMPPASNHPEETRQMKILHLYRFTHTTHMVTRHIHSMHACLDTHTHKNAHLLTVFISNQQPLHKTEQIICQLFSNSSCQI